jgi:archaellum component FlaC
VESGKITPAINQVNAFISKVENDIQHGEISSAAGNNLIASANQLIATLQ